VFGSGFGHQFDVGSAEDFALVAVYYFVLVRSPAPHAGFVSTNSQKNIVERSPFFTNLHNETDLKYSF
jgi:hypothetical protein